VLSEIKPHLEELRKRIFISVLALIVGFVLSFIFYKPILDWVTAPLERALYQVNKQVQKSQEGQWNITSKDANGTIIKGKMKETNTTLSLVDRAIKNAQNIIDSNSSTKSEKSLALSIKQLAEYSKTLAKKDSNVTKKSSAGGSVLWGSVTTNQIGGVFIVALKVSLYAAIFLALPIILWQGWLFVAPGLYDNEKKMALPFLIGVTVMFAIGVLFAYYVVTPFGFQFLITFGAFLYTPLINIEDYIGFFAKILFGFGIAFELPMIVYFLASIGLVTERTLIGFFKYAIVIIFIVAALLTPPDVITQMLMAAPLILLYGISILVAKIINPYKEDEEEEKEDKEQPKLSEQNE
jgi:sec-independent protein translocase protein TatC